MRIDELREWPDAPQAPEAKRKDPIAVAKIDRSRVVPLPSPADGG